MDEVRDVPAADLPVLEPIPSHPSRGTSPEADKCLLDHGVQYFQVWYSSLDGINIPADNLALLKTPQPVQRGVGNTALNKLQNHGWYLSEDLAGFGFFSNFVLED